LQQLVNKVDVLIVGGGIANTFLVASGYNIGNSLYEPDFVDLAKDLLSNKKCKILFPEDVVVAVQIAEQIDTKVKELLSIDHHEKVLDFGPETLSIYKKEIQLAKTILWNGPVGVFEYKPFASGTKHLAKAIADSSAYSVAGGGDTISAINQFNVARDISYISTGGGAFLEYIEGKFLPGIEVLR
jgi:phosphoglycerate kinase